MSIFLHIMSHNIVPIFTLIALGFYLGRKFDLNLLTLSKLNLYLFMPAFMFVNLYSTTLRPEMLSVFLCGSSLLFANELLGRGISKIRNHDIGLSSAFKNSIMFNNSGNIGLSLIILVFGNPPFVVNGTTPYLTEALTAQIIILVLQNITTNTIGFFNAGRAMLDTKAALLQVFTMPSIYAVLAAFFFKWLQFDLTGTAIWPALDYLKGGLVPIALLTLGVQLAKTDFNFKDTDVYLSVFTRLILGPMLAAAFIHLFGFTGVIAQTLLIAYAVPTAVNTALIAIEMNNHENFAAQTVMTSTLLSAITLTGAIYAARLLFPV